MSACGMLSEIDAATLERVRAGEIVSMVDSAAQRGVAELVAWGGFQSPPPAVWTILDDIEGYVRTMPRVKTSEVLWRGDSGLRMRLVLDTPFPLPDISAILESEHTVDVDGVWKRQWQQIDKSLLPNSGSWTLTALPERPGHTLARYQVRVEPKIPLPARLIQFAQRRVLPDLFRSIDEHAAKLGTASE